MLVHAQSPTTFPNLTNLLAQCYYCARETYIIVYCPNFITASAVLTAYSPQLTLLFNYDCNIHMHACSNCQASTPTSLTFYSLIFHNTTPAGSSKSTKQPALIWDYTGPLPEYEAKTAPLQKQGYINVHPVLTFVINTLLTQDEATIPASQLIKSQLDAPPPVFFAHLLCLFTPCEGFVVDINSTSPWPVIGAI